MRRIAAVALILALALLCAPGAHAQGKDPFRPPPAAGAGTEPGAGPGSPVLEPVPVDQAPSGDLAKTGQDVAGQLSLGLAILSLGLVLKIVELAMVAGGRGAARRMHAGA